MNIIGIIPARMGSSRFPGKPLAKIMGRAMIHHVYSRCEKAGILEGVYVATCDKEIEKYCIENKMNVIMTKDTHERASDRVAEAVLKIEKEKKEKIDIVVMIQGDEPLVNSTMIEKALEPLLKDEKVYLTNLMARLDSEEEQNDPNEIKVVVDKDNFALYFSREPIPSRKKSAKAPLMYKQVCVIPFKRDFLTKFNELPPTTLESIESIDMLRVLEHGYRVKMVLAGFKTYSVDTPEDLCNVEELMKKELSCAKKI